MIDKQRFRVPNSPPDDTDAKPPDQAICRGEMVARAGIEPATFRFSGGRSYQLSYLAAGTQLNAIRETPDCSGAYLRP